MTVVSYLFICDRKGESLPGGERWIRPSVPFGGKRRASERYVISHYGFQHDAKRWDSKKQKKKIWPLRHIFSFATVKANRCLVGRDGFEPSKSWTTDLQSVPFGRSGISPYFGAGERNRTINLLITNQLLCLLSYTSIVCVENRTLKRKKPQWMVLRGGIEPPTRGFSVPCSTYWATEAKHWRPGRGSNPRPPAWQAGVLTNCTTGPNNRCFAFLVGLQGLEPRTNRLWADRSDQLS